MIPISRLSLNPCSFPPLNAAIIATNKAIADICGQVLRRIDLNGVIAPSGVLKLTDDGVHRIALADALGRVRDAIFTDRGPPCVSTVG